MPILDESYISSPLTTPLPLTLPTSPSRHSSPPTKQSRLQHIHALRPPLLFSLALFSTSSRDGPARVIV